MESPAQFLLAVGGILLFGQLISALGRFLFLPRVTMLLIFGVAIGSDVLDVVPHALVQGFDLIANMALLMVGFLLGGRLTIDYLRTTMGRILWISLSAALVTTLLVSLGLMWTGTQKEIALLLGCIAAATAPAAVLDVVMESGHKGPFGDLLLSIVALDDAWALMLFGIGVALVHSFDSMGGNSSVLILTLKDIGGAIVLGVLIGFPASYLTGRIKPGKPMLTEALGLVFICGGLAVWMNVSFLISAMVLGAVVANFARHHEYPFHAIEGVEWPFIVIFFVLAGASLDLDQLGEVGSVAVVYVLCRIVGKITGAVIGGRCGGAEVSTRRWMGVALLPQAGVAIGMALVASSYFPEYRQVLLSVVISSTIFFEIIGPVFTRMAIRRTQ
jgi:Kef-type K+ transport system membrane component KefB